MKIRKRRKSSRIKSRTHGHSAKLHKGKGSRGGKGMSGTGKRGDQKKSYVLKKYKIYFGKKGETSKKTQKKKNLVLNLEQIQENLGKFIEKGKDKEINLEKYKILGRGEIKDKLIIKAKSASKSAIKKIEKAGGKIILRKKEEKEEKNKDREKQEKAEKKVRKEGKEKEIEKEDKKAGKENAV